jgi:hypothetical protein
LIGRLLISRVFGLLIDGRALGLIIASTIGVILAFEFGKNLEKMTEVTNKGKRILSISRLD